MRSNAITNRFKRRYRPYSSNRVENKEHYRVSVGQAGSRRVQVSSVESQLKTFLEAGEQAAGSDNSADLYRESSALSRFAVREGKIEPLRNNLVKACLEGNFQAYYDRILQAIREGMVLTVREYSHFQSHIFEQSVAHMIPLHILSALSSVVPDGNLIFQCLKNPVSYIQPSIDQLRANGNLKIGLVSNRGLIVLIYSYTLMLETLLENAIRKKQSAVCPIPCDRYAVPKPANKFAKYILGFEQTVAMHARMQTLNQMLQALLDHNADLAEHLAKQCTPGMEEFFTEALSLPISQEEAHTLLKDRILHSPESFQMTALLNALEEN